MLKVGKPSCVQPPPQKLLPEHAQTLERYAWESFDPHSQGICRYVDVLFSEGLVNVFLLFSDVPARERLPAAAVCGGEFPTFWDISE